jgi:hypothetical protein
MLQSQPIFIQAKSEQYSPSPFYGQRKTEVSRARLHVKGVRMRSREQEDGFQEDSTPPKVGNAPTLPARKIVDKVFLW